MTSTRNQFWFGGEDKSFNFGSEASFGSFMKSFLNTDGSAAPSSFPLDGPTTLSPLALADPKHSLRGDVSKLHSNSNNNSDVSATRQLPGFSGLLSSEVVASNSTVPSSSSPSSSSVPSPNIERNRGDNHETSRLLTERKESSSSSSSSSSPSSSSSSSSSSTSTSPSSSDLSKVLSGDALPKGLQFSQSDQRNVQLAVPNTTTTVATVSNGVQYVDITEYLNLPQTIAAKKLDIPTSTLSKRWKEAARKRKWPYRTLCKLDKEITTLLHNMPQGPNAGSLPPEVEQALGYLLKKRQEELRPVVIRI